MTIEINFDGLVGPTHHYGGLSRGNIPSQENKSSVSNPKEAALQGLEKMKFLSNRGVIQGVFPPHERPHLSTLRALGFSGTDAGVLKSSWDLAPEILTQVSSSAFMWAANAATVCPSADSIDNHLHFTTANLTSNFHRAIEKETTEKTLKTIFKDPVYFKHHSPLPDGRHFADEGAANHCRFCKTHGGVGVQLFVYGYTSFKPSPLIPKQYPARQSFEASQAISRLHRLHHEKTLFVQQNPEAIDRGVFHNDVAAVSNMNFFFFHEKAFIGKDSLIDEIRRKVAECCEVDMTFLEVSEKQIPLKAAVRSYLFNSQMITLPDGGVCMIAPIECQEDEQVKRYIDALLLSPENPIREVHYLNLRQSMFNGGGPACLRLRVVMNKNEQEAMLNQVLFNDRLYKKLTDWVNKHYRDRLELKDLHDPMLLQESKTALDELTRILQLGHFYSFQSYSR